MAVAGTNGINVLANSSSALVFGMAQMPLIGIFFPPS